MTTALTLRLRTSVGQSCAILLVVISCFSAVANEMPGAAWYAPAETMLTGRLVQRVYPGPPNYESVAKGDRLERPLVLELDHPVQVRHKDFPDEDPRSASEIQVMRGNTGDPKEEAALDERIAAAIEQEVVVKMKLFVAHTAHHRTPVLGEILQIRRKGEKEFTPLPHLSAEEQAAAEAKRLVQREKRLSEVQVVDGAAPNAVFTGYTRFVGTLVERRVKPQSSWESWIKDGEKVCWILQLDQPIVLRERRSSSTPEPITVRELDVLFPFNDPLAQRDLRALGIVAQDPWDVGCAPLFGKRYVIVGRLFPNSRFSNRYAEAQLRVDRIHAATK